MQTYAPPTASAELDRLQQRGLIVGVAGAVLGAIGVLVSPAQFLPSWLIGFALCLGLTLGSLALLMLQHMTGGKWGVASRRIFEAASRLIPYCVVLFLPIAIMLPKLYVWARPEAVAADEILQYKQIYLNVPFFLIRAAIYFIVWFGCAYFLNKWSAAQDRGEVAVTEADTRRFRVISAPGLLIYVILISLARDRLADVARPALVLHDLRLHHRRRRRHVGVLRGDHRAVDAVGRASRWRRRRGPCSSTISAT